MNRPVHSKRLRHPLSGLTAAQSAVRHRIAPLLGGTLAYAAAFAALGQLGQLGQLWSRNEFYSIWFPAAGLRFAVLWLFGPTTAPLLVVGEALAWIVFASSDNSLAEAPTAVAIIAFRCAAYAAAAYFARKLKFQCAPAECETLRYGVAAAVAPVAAFGLTLPWHMTAEQPGFAGSSAHVAAEGITYFTGDLLGILLIAPPLIYLSELTRDRRLPAFGPRRQWIETAAMMAIAACFVLLIAFAGFGIQVLPVIVATGVIGMMFGRKAAWIAALPVSLLVLGITATAAPDLNSVSLHLQLAAVMVVGMLAGACRDDQVALRQELHSRDSALLHVERLRSLRAMSLAVIHELSQPLSTLSIETKYLAKLSHSPAANAEELRSVSELIAKKTENLAAMLRRLRTFGAAPGEDPSVIDVDKLVRDVAAIVAPEAAAAGVRIEMRLKEGVAVVGQEVELQQALLNLLRNAIASSPASTVRLRAEQRGHKVQLDISNSPSSESSYRKGMGVGKLIVEAIAQMHGGELREEQSATGEWTMSLVLVAPAVKEGQRHDAASASRVRRRR